MFKLEHNAAAIHAEELEQMSEIYSYSEMLSLVELNATMAPKAWKIYGSEICGRCGGGGRHSFCQDYGDKCFGCMGRGRVLTSAGEKFHFAKGRVVSKFGKPLISEILLELEIMMTEARKPKERKSIKEAADKLSIYHSAQISVLEEFKSLGENAYLENYAIAKK